MCDCILSPLPWGVVGVGCVIGVLSPLPWGGVGRCVIGILSPLPWGGVGCVIGFLSRRSMQ